MCHIDGMVRREQIMVKINCNHNYVAVVFVIFVLGVYADEHTHTYVDGEEVVLWMNSVGPYYNRQETYAYFSLPFCAGPYDTVSHYRKSLVEALQGMDIEFSGLRIVFKEDVISTPYCEILLTKEKQKALIHAVKNHYWYQMYLDDIPVWGFVGELTETENGTSYHLWTHKKFEIGYNGNQIVDVNFTSENKVNLVEVERILFTYEVIWKNSLIKFEDRVDKYSDPYYLQLRMRWFSIISIFIMLILLVGLGSMILMRKLLEDYARCSKGQPKISTIFATSSPSKIQHVRLI